MIIEYDNKTIKQYIRYISIKKFKFARDGKYLLQHESSNVQRIEIHRTSIYFSGVKVASGFKTVGEGLAWIIRKKRKYK